MGTPRRINMVGQRFGMLEVIAEAPFDNTKKNYSARWLCRCNCGNEIVVRRAQLVQYGKTDCGCVKEAETNLVGNRYGSLVVVERIPPFCNETKDNVSTLWRCVCDCGNEKFAYGNELKSGKNIRCRNCSYKASGDGIKEARRREAEKLIGETFGDLTVVSINDIGLTSKRFHCICKCGQEKDVTKADLSSESQTTCHCNSLRKGNSGPREDLRGQRFGRLTVIEYAGNNTDGDVRSQKKYKKTKWLCRCDCGEERIVFGDSLKKGKTQSCGCLKRENTSKLLTKDLTGKKFGSLQVIERVENNKFGQSQYLCRCDCGNEKVAMASLLVKGNVTSCGCRKYTFDHSQFSVGDKINSWTVLDTNEIREPNKSPSILCQCECGTIKKVNIYQLADGSSSSCGCNRVKNTDFEKQRVDLTGKRFGRLTALRFGEGAIEESTGRKVTTWICRCDCGEIVDVRTRLLTEGHKFSCGCMASSGEIAVKKILDENNVQYKRQVSFPELRGVGGKPLKYDFGIKNENNEIEKLIEFDGDQHYIVNAWWGGEEALKTRKEHDSRKTHYADEHGIPLLRIKEEDKDKLSDIISKFLSA